MLDIAVYAFVAALVSPIFITVLHFRFARLAERQHAVEVELARLKGRLGIEEPARPRDAGGKHTWDIGDARSIRPESRPRERGA